MGSVMKLCKDCKHFNNHTLTLTCTAPSNGINFVTGKPKTFWCHTSRNTAELCGYEGKYFEPKEEKPFKPVSWWRNLIGL
jgi:hypothetical protein